MEKYKNSSLSPAERAEDLLARMTLEEKAAQINIIRGVEYAVNPSKKHACSVEYGSNFRFDDIKRDLGDRGIGFVHDVYSEPAVLNKLQKYMIEQTRLSIPCVFTGEALHGLCAIGASNFPTPLCLAASFDTELVSRIGSCIANETRSRGIQEVLAPVLDVARDPRWGRFEETFGEDTLLARKMAGAIVSGQQKGDISRPDAVMCEPKHFCVHGIAEGGSNCQNARAGVREIEESYLPVFKAAFDAGAKNVMVSYNAIDGDVMMTSHHYLTEVLKERMGLTGYSRADWGGVSRIVHNHHLTASKDKAVEMALNAGLDMQGACDYPATVWSETVVRLVNEGRVSMERLNDAVRRVLKVKFELGLFEYPYTDENAHLKTVCCEKHDKASLEAAVKGSVLLKNDGILPLDINKIKSVALIGPFSATAKSGGYSALSERHIATVYEELKRALPENTEIMQCDGCAVYEAPDTADAELQPHLIRERTKNQEENLEKAIEYAEKCDVTIFIGGDSPEICNEGRDRATLSLYGRQGELIKRAAATGKPVITVLMCGRPPVIAEESACSAAVMLCFNGGDFSSRAVVSLITGKSSPAGRCPMSLPRGEGRFPCYYTMLPGGAEKSYVEGDKTALYPFGHGLTYTSFEYSAMTVTRGGKYDFSVSVEIKNTGKRDGEEVVQLYVCDPESDHATPDKKLVAFSRIAVSAGRNATAELKFGFDELKCYNLSGRFEVPAGEYILYAAASSDDVRLTQSINIL